MSALKGRGQTALEALFIMAVVFTALALIVSSYGENSSKISALDGIRSVASDVASYVSVGVIAENVSGFDNLNKNMTAYPDYLTGRFSFEGIKVQNETKKSMTVLVKFRTLGGDNSTIDEQLVKAIGGAMMESLKEIKGFTKRNGRLYYNGISIKLNVSVNDRWGVFP